MRTLRRLVWTASLGLLLAAVGCGAGGLAAPIGAPVADPAAFAASLRDAVRPATPERVTFRWTLDEQGSRVSGRGVVRAEAPDRLRLDLFGERGDTYLIAALVGDEYRLPPEAANAVALPSPALLWAALGVLRPPTDASLSSATASDGAAELRYQTSDGHVFAYSFAGTAGDSFALTRLERAGPRGVVETVSVEHAAGGTTVSRTSYRDWNAFRDLALTIEEITAASSFPPDIWRPDAGSR